MVTLACQNCERTFSVPQWQANRGRKFCGRGCQNAAAKGKPRPGLRPGKTTLQCLQCGQDFEVWTSWVKRGRRKFCSWDCKGAYQATLTGELSHRTGVPHTPEAKAKIAAAATGRTGPLNARWRGGRSNTGHGYVNVALDSLAPESRAIVAPMVSKNGYVLEHRAVMALALGRALLPTEHVHHVNGDKMDNRPDNLTVMDWSNHSREHRQIERKMAQLIDDNRRLTFLLATFLRSGVTTSS